MPSDCQQWGETERPQLTFSDSFLKVSLLGVFAWEYTELGEGKKTVLGAKARGAEESEGMARTGYAEEGRCSYCSQLGLDVVQEHLSGSKCKHTREL